VIDYNTQVIPTKLSAKQINSKYEEKVSTGQSNGLFMHFIDSNDKAARMQQGEKQQFFKDQKSVLCR